MRGGEKGVGERGRNGDTEEKCSKGGVVTQISEGGIKEGWGVALK